MSVKPLLHELSELLNPARYGDDSRRIVHGRGHTLPGYEWLTIDWHPPVLVATLYKNPGEQALNDLLELLKTNHQQTNIPTFIQYRFSGELVDQWLGEAPEQVFASRNELKFELNLGERQNLGYFIDMEPGRQWLETICREQPGSRGLNLFAYTCALSCVALSSGASEVVNVDMSRGALTIGQRNHQWNNLKGGRFLKMDVLKSWKKLASNGPYDWVILDPPSYQKGSFVAQKDYQKLLRHLPKVLSPGTQILAALNAPELPESFLNDLIAEQLPTAKFIERLPMHEDFPEADRDRGLKLLVYRYE
ncbi:class I SAM-dependent methyltransferase [Porticoccaceae bacterium LTM1]|nr:class I SAM-dependent methyltransferase [Porticoccaceae bacterium LTM1]